MAECACWRHRTHKERRDFFCRRVVSRYEALLTCSCTIIWPGMVMHAVKPFFLATSPNEMPVEAFVDLITCVPLSRPTSISRILNVLRLLPSRKPFHTRGCAHINVQYINHTHTHHTRTHTHTHTSKHTHTHTHKHRLRQRRGYMLCGDHEPRWRDKPQDQKVDGGNQGYGGCSACAANRDYRV
jgi:hypothetical protein